MEKDVSKFDKKFLKNYDKDSKKGYTFEADNECPKDFHDLHSDLPFLPEKMKIKKCNKLVCNLYDKKMWSSHKSFKTSIKPQISFEKSALNKSI